MRESRKLNLGCAIVVAATAAMSVFSGGLASPATATSQASMAAAEPAPSEVLNHFRIVGTDDCLAYRDTEVLLARCGTAGTRWSVLPITSTTFHVKTDKGDQCLGAGNSSTVPWLDDCTTLSSSQKWMFSNLGSATQIRAHIENYATQDYLNDNYAGGVRMVGMNSDHTDWEWIPAGGIGMRNPGTQAGIVGTAIRPVAVPVMSGGGETPYTWSATDLPPGLQINRETGTITGTPTTAGVFNVNVTARDSTSIPRTGTTTVPWTINEVPAPSCSGTNDTELAIPDNGATVELFIAIGGCGRNASNQADIGVSITHDYQIGDLDVWLVTPTGRKFLLHGKDTPPFTPNLDKIYTWDLSSQPADGMWRLQVKDWRFDGKVGKVNNWSLQL